MDFLTQSKAKGIGVLVSPRSGEDAGYKALLKLTAVLSLRGSVRVLDCGNRFDVYEVARLVRRQTPQVTETLERISVARAFTCYQVVSLLEDTAAAPEPTVVIDLLATFYDENVAVGEIQRLLYLVLGRLQKLSLAAPVLISLYPPHRPERAGLVSAVCNVAEHVLVYERPVVYRAGRLF
jgi:hypothetical protein